MKEYVGIYDEDAAYSSKLALALLSRKVFAAEVVEFTKVEKIEEFLRTNRLVLLLISESAWTKELAETKIGCIILLSGQPERGGSSSTDGGMDVVFKYQSVTALSKEILRKFQPSFEVSSVASPIGCRDKQIIGIYSPIKRCLKSSFAIAAAQILGERQSTLLLNFEEFSAMRQLLFEKGEANAGDLSDMLYYFLQGELLGKEDSFIRAFHSFDCILPTRCPEDIRGLKPEEVIAFLWHLLEKTDYQCLVVDFGDTLAGIEQILKCCTKIYMPVKEDIISELKKQAFLDYLQNADETLSDLIAEVKPPYHHMFRSDTKSYGSGSYFHQLADGAFFDYVRQML